MNITSLRASFARLSSGKPHVLPRLRWHATSAQRALGSWGMLALLLISAALGTQLGIINPGKDDLSLRLQMALDGIASNPEAVEVRPPTKIDQLPGTETFDARLEKILSTLQSNRFLVDKANFTYSTVDENKLQRLSVDIPMYGSYIKLRDVLPLIVQEPGVRIERVSIQRANISQTTASVDLKLSLLGIRK